MNPLFNQNQQQNQQPTNQINNWLVEFNKFKNEMAGKDPNQILNELVQSGRVSQEQLNQAMDFAKKMSQFLK